ncbi:polymorphic toxin-type HINT domain-containing protein [Streptomyces sp. CG1]|uniref:polymorphic toxin-type HINT domain-containing protein n=1 Tax=Streptomyces sp. CG1 TaxID=1287523 RepID=UPI0034E27D9E
MQTDQAGKYAADAKKSADQAQDSANQAADSAKTARSAADRADQDTASADESAAQAEFSADYARNSAYAANDAADEAWDDAVRARESATEAKSEASKAWSDVVAKLRAEEAAARKQAEEQRQQQREKERQAKEQKRCIAYMSRDNLPPCGLAGQPVELPEASPDLAKLLLKGGMEVFGVNDLIDCAKNPTLGKCALAVVGVLPIGKLKLLKKAADGVEDIAEASRAAKAAEKCLQCFLAGTKVLMADGTTKNIESVEIGDQVLATDPMTGVTGARTVTDLIVTEHDKHFSDLTIATRRGIEHLTATNEHPFWSPSAGAWVAAGRLRAGSTLRTVDGTTVTVRHNRSFEKTARTYNLTVADLHTYYVLAGETPILVHNANCNIAEARRLQAKLAAEELAGADGHAFRKHVVEQGEFPGIQTREQFAEMVEDVVLNGERRVAGGGRSAYWRNGVIVIRNPNSRDGGTVFAPKDGKQYFLTNFRPE